MFQSSLLLIGTLIQSILAQAWNYTLAGRDWSGNGCISVDNLSQSPIDISFHSCTCNSDLSLEIDFPAKRNPQANVTLAGNPPTITTLLSEDFAHVYFKLSKGRFKSYRSYQLTFRTPSEHLLDGKAYPLELQIYLKSGYDEILGLSVLYDYSPKDIENVIFEDFLAAFQKNVTLTQLKTGKSAIFPNYINYNKAFINHTDFFHYNGTRTDTDCTVPVNWVVLASPFYLRKSDLDIYKSLLKNNTKLETNAREEQELNDRVIFVSGEECYSVFSNMFSFGFIYSSVIYLIFKMI